MVPLFAHGLSSRLLLRYTICTVDTDFAVPEHTVRHKGCNVQEEERLVRLAQTGDQDAFGRLYQLYFDRVYSYIRVRLGSKVVTEDLTQQVFLNMIQSLPAFRWRGVPFSAWVFRIARNQVIDHLRRSGKKMAVPLDERMHNSAEPSAEDALEQVLTREELIDAINKLTQAQREVIALRFGAQLSTKETAQAMKKNLTAVKALQHSALAALRKIMSAGKQDG